ncbi:MAG: TIGR03862 family flavoprotein, partial [Acinetobacter sp.]|nr:TIGR03862 family flavoprotein [Acinetobacter sp.]
GSSGRIFPVEMKAAPLLRAWLAHLKAHHVQFFYRHQITQLQENTLTIQSLAEQTTVQHSYDAIILACGAISWPQLGSDGQWQAWFNADDLQPFYASNVGIECAWSAFLTPYFGQALKRVTAWVNDGQTVHGDIVISHYGLESGLIYKLNTDLRQQFQQLGTMNLMLDLLPDETLAHIQQQLQQKNKQSLNSKLKRLGLDVVKIALLRECTDKNRWQDAQYMAQHIKQCTVIAHDFRPIQEAISCAGGVKRNALHDDGFQLKANPKVYCCGEMLDWDAPTGGYLLTACFATGRAVGEQIQTNLGLTKK